MGVGNQARCVRRRQKRCCIDEQGKNSYISRQVPHWTRHTIADCRRHTFDWGQFLGNFQALGTDLQQN